MTIRTLLISNDDETGKLVEKVARELPPSEIDLVIAKGLDGTIEPVAGGAVDLVLLDFSRGHQAKHPGLVHKARAAFSAPVVVLLLQEDEADAVTALREGAQNYLVKDQLTSRCLFQSIRQAIAIASVQEISDRGQAFLDLVESFPDALVIVNADGRIVIVNRQLEELFGYERSEIVGELVEILVPERFRASHGQRRVSGGAWLATRPMGLGLDIFGRREDGTEFPADISLNTLRSTGHTLVVAAVRDMTRYRKIESALRENERLLHAIVDGAEALIYVKDRDGKYVLTNRGFEAAFRLRPEQAKGKRDHDLLPKDVADMFAAADQKVLSAGKAFRSEESVPQHDGPHMYWSLRFPLRDPSGAPSVVCGIATDITARKEVEITLKRLVEATDAMNRLKSEFLRSVTHEFRTPLNGVLGFAEIILETNLTSEQRECVAAIKASGLRLQCLIDDLLDFTMLEEGRLHVAPAPLLLRNSIQAVLDSFESVSRTKGVRLTSRVAEDAPNRLLGDGVRIFQILRNLVDNAVKFTERGEVKVEARLGLGGSVGHLLHMTVLDTGIGIPAEKHERIFKAFSQVDGSMARRFEGLGLGLALCAELVRLLAGRVWFESRVGSGTAFHFCVPVQIVEEAE